MKSDVNSSELFPYNYDVYRRDRKLDRLDLTCGGGVLLAIDNTIKSETIDTSCFEENFPEIDLIVCKCFLSYISFLIVTVYIPPSLPLDNFENFLEAIGGWDLINSERVLFIGDFNSTHFIDSNLEDKKTRMITNMIAFTNMKQCNNILNNNDKLLDLVISNMDCSVNRDDVPLVNEDPYHPSLSIELYGLATTRDSFSSNDSKRTLNFKKANYYSLYNELLYTNWDFLSMSAEINTIVDSFYNKFYEILNNHVPLSKNFKHVYPVWYTSEIIKLVKEKAKVHKRYKITGITSCYQEFSILRLKIKQKIKEAYALYLNNVEIKLKDDPKNFWTFVNNKNRTTRIPGKMVYNGESYETPQMIVNAFSKFFESSYLRPIDEEETVILNFDCNVILDTSCEPITEAEILLAGKRLKNNMTSGPDGIPSFLVKDCLRILIQPLQTILNSILKASVFPEVWKIAKVCPIHKGQDRNSVSNYRPISILNNFAKILETILYNRIYVSTKHIISVRQHGFMNSKSTITNLATFSQYLCETLDRRGQVDAVYTDLSKAFDKVSHKILLQKLSCMGFKGNYLKLLKSYLINRKQFVCYNGFLSNVYSATSGVPQGSNLGPLLFLIFINDLCSSLECNNLMFADDLKLYSSITTLDDCIILQNQIDILHHWCLKNRLELNISKCKILTFSRKVTTLQYSYNIDNVILERCDTIKDLGVHFDHQLTFNYHINSIVNSAYSAYGFIYRNCKNFNNISVLTRLFYSLVRSKLEYGSIIWSPIYNQYISDIDKVQKKFLKFLSFKSSGVYPPRGCNYADLLCTFDFVSLEKRRNQAAVLFLHKLLNCRIDCPDLLAQIDIVVPRTTSRQNNTFLCKRARTNLMSKSPTNLMCRNANKLSTVCDIFCCSIRELKIKSRAYL